jgi:phage shock protein C
MENRKLTKSNNRMIAGVCGGVADFLGWDPTLVRVIWALCILLGGFGLILYIILWLVMPKAPKKSYQDRMQEKLHGRGTE